MHISSNLMTISSKQSLKHKEIQYWTDFLLCKSGTKQRLQSLFCIAPGAFIRRNTVTLPNENILTLSTLKAITEDKFSVAKMMVSVLDGIENIVGKGENAGYQHFLLFPQCFQKLSFSGSLKVGIVWYKVK